VADPPLHGEWAWPPVAPPARPEAATPPTAAARASMMAHTTAAHGAGAATAPFSVPAAAPAPQRIVMPKREVAAAPRPEDRSVWARLRRTLFGDSKPVFED
jgi:hypothetical protein